MLSSGAWAAVSIAAVGATLVATHTADPHILMATAGAVGLVITFLAVRDQDRLVATGASSSAIASSTARHLGLVWAWGALSLISSYLWVMDRVWHEWWQFVLGFAVAAIASFGFAWLLNRDEAQGNADNTLLVIGRRLLQVQLAGMVVGIVSLFVDQKFPRGTQHADWVGCTICFFGALAIAAISLNALRVPAERVMQR